MDKMDVVSAETTKATRSGNSEEGNEEDIVTKQIESNFLNNFLGLVELIWGKAPMPEIYLLGLKGC